MVLFGFAGAVPGEDVMIGVGGIHRSQTHFLFRHSDIGLDKTKSKRSRHNHSQKHKRSAVDINTKDWIKRNRSAVDINTPKNKNKAQST